MAKIERTNQCDSDKFLAIVINKNKHRKKWETTTFADSCASPAAGGSRLLLLLAE